LILGTSLTAKAEDVYMSCNGCSYIEHEEAALKVMPRNGIVHLLDAQAGQVVSYEVVHEYESGTHIRYVNRIASPTDLIAASQSLGQLISQTLASGGTFDTYRNTLTQTVDIPPHIATKSAQLVEHEVSARVSNHLRIVLIAEFSQKLSKAWERVVEKIIFKVEAKFADGSTAIYALGPIFFSDHPFILERDSIKDPNGIPLFTPPSTSREIFYDRTETRGGGGRLYQQCKSYTIG